MARPLRIEFPGALYHITSRGNEQRRIFKSDRDRTQFLLFLGEVARRFGWSVTAYVLMSNHFHLVIQTPEPNLSKGMHWLKGTYAAWFNRHHRRSGHLFQGRFHALLVEKESYFTQVLRYVVLNPVRAGMVRRPEDYRWSSYRATAGLTVAPEWLDVSAALAIFGSELPAARAEYQAFVENGIGCTKRLWDELVNALYLGTEPWLKQMRTIVESKPRSTDHPLAQRAVGRPEMQTIIGTVAGIAQLPRDVVKSVRGGAVRRLIAWLGWYEGYVTLRSIAASLRLRSEGYVSSLIRRCERELSVDPLLLQQLDDALVALR
ncbi:MAG TPA: transposase [Thermoanaerobaculia bacterium]